MRCSMRPAVWRALASNTARSRACSLSRSCTHSPTVNASMIAPTNSAIRGGRARFTTRVSVVLELRHLAGQGGGEILLEDAPHRAVAAHRLDDVAPGLLLRDAERLARHHQPV